MFREFYGGQERYQENRAEPETVAATFVEEGDWIEATVDGGRDKAGLPEQVPIRGKLYRVERFYMAPYGIGVVLRDEHDQPLDPYPYRGYVFAQFQAQDSLGITFRMLAKFKKVKGK